MGGMLSPIPGIGPIGGRVAGDILTGGLAEAMPSSVKDPLYHGMGSLLFSPLSGLAAGGAGLAAGGLGAGGMGAAASPTVGASGLEGVSQFAVPSAAQSLVPTGAGSVLPASGVAGLANPIGGGLASGSALNAASPAAAGTSGTNMLQNAFLATSIGGMLGNAIHPPPLYPPAGIPAPPIGHGGGFTPVSQQSIQQLAQLMAQRRAQQTGKFTV